MEQIIAVLVLGAVDSAVIAVACIGLTLQFGVTNYLNFGYTEFLTFGAFMAFTLTSSFVHLNIWLALILASLCSAALAAVLNRALFARFARRARDPFTILIVTFMVGFMLNQLMLFIWGPDTQELSAGNSTQLSLGSHVTVSLQELLFLGVAIVAMIAIEALLHLTRMGRSMRAISDNSSLARACGLNIRVITDVTWLISGFMGGLAGVILALEVHAFDVTLGDGYLYLIYPAVVIGGIGNISGALVASILVGVLIALGSIVLPSSVSIALLFVALVGVVLLRPTGIIGGGRHPSLREA
jgi:branched-subunit amino acid ABC-type transport system permease component